MWKTADGSTGRLIQLCAAYFFFYVLTGVSVKYFMGSPALGMPGMKDMEFLVWSTLGGSLICLLVVFAAGWYKTASERFIAWGPLRMPIELTYIIPSGVCTAVVIPTTTLMYMLPISVMVAMVIMRASVIVISRLVDALQIRQGILRKKVYWEENAAVAFALLAAGSKLFFAKSQDFDFVHNPAAVAILSSYILAYALRIYIMNYYKNTRPAGAPLNNRWFFSIEQITASLTMALITLVILSNGWSSAPLRVFHDAVAYPHPQWAPATLSGVAYGMVAFFSVFIFMFKGRTATFSGLVNRLTSLVAGTTATLLSYFIFRDKFPSAADWLALGLILVAVAFLSAAERKRVSELISEAK